MQNSCELSLTNANRLKAIAEREWPTRGVGLIWLSRTDLHLLPTIQSSLAQLGFVDKFSGIVWFKTMSDGTHRGVAIVTFDLPTKLDIAATTLLARNLIIIASGSNHDTDVPTFIDKVTDQSSTDQETLHFNIPFDTNGPTMDCDHLCTVESLDIDHFSPEIRYAFDRVLLMEQTWKKYLVFTSPRHQHQLTLLLDSITSSYEVAVQYSVIPLLFAHQVLDEEQTLAPLRKIGFDAIVLLRTSFEHVGYCYLFADFFIMTLFYLRSFRETYPEFLILACPCISFIKRIHKEQKNTSTEQEIDELLAFFSLDQYDIKNLLCREPNCLHNMRTHKRLSDYGARSRRTIAKK